MGCCQDRKSFMKIKKKILISHWADLYLTTSKVKKTNCKIT